MPQDDVLEQLVRDALAGAPPALTPGFEARLLRRVTPARPSRGGRGVLAAYAVTATAVVAWCLRDLPVTAVVSAFAVCVPVAGAASAYAHRVVRGR